MAQPRVQLFWWEGCPSWERALAALRDEMAAAGLDPDSVAVREIKTLEGAERQRFPGSPTIRVDGEDIQRPEHGEHPGLTCRVYRRRDGRLSPLPDPQDIRDALRKATE